MSLKVTKTKLWLFLQTSSQKRVKTEQKQKTVLLKALWCFILSDGFGLKCKIRRKVKAGSALVKACKCEMDHQNLETIIVIEFKCLKRKLDLVTFKWIRWTIPSKDVIPRKNKWLKITSQERNNLKFIQQIYYISENKVWWKCLSNGH